MHKLVLLRHGESGWNRENRFTGWTDVDLSAQGTEEARSAGRLLKAEGYAFDAAYTSVLKRAIRTLNLALEELDQLWLPVAKDWQLNERHYGALQGLNKAETAAKFGEAQVLVWRRSYETPPPALEPGDPRHESRDPRYAGVAVPRTECLKDTVARVLPFWESTIAPAVRRGQRILVAAHGNSLRALIKHLDAVSDADIVGLNVPTGVPLVYELDDKLRPLRHYYLGDAEEIAKRVAAVAAQGENQSLNRILLVVLLLAAALAQGAPGASAGTAREQDLAALRARIETLRNELEDRESSRREERDALRASEVAIAEASRALRAVEAEARAARAAIAELAARSAGQKRSLDTGQAALGRLLAARAVVGISGAAPDFVRLALSGEDLADAARKLHYLTYVSRAAAQMIDVHRSSLAEAARLRAESEAKARELALLEARGRSERELLLKERREHRRLLERIAGEIRSAKKRIQMLLADESRLARLVQEIGKLLAARPGAGYARVTAVPEAGAAGATGLFSRLKGSLRLPVRGELAGRFGTPSSEGGVSNKGVFIRAPEGEQVRAVGAGRVVYADWMRGFGHLLIVDHGEAFLSIYGNNESLLKQTGDTVTLGEPLATVGHSGGNEQTGLYFELRHLGRPFDPLRWVKLK